MTSGCQVLRLADITDVPRLLQSEDLSHEWPPPGVTVSRYGFPETWAMACGPPPPGGDGFWYVTDLATIALGIDGDVARIAASLGATLSGVETLGLASLGQWPVIYEVGKVNTMRWISAVFRGTLGGIDEFQHGINFGKPGNDPDLSEAASQAYADALASRWQAAMGILFNSCGPDVVYTEVGVTQKEQHSATAADGSGGDLEQAYPTAWSHYPLASQPHGVVGAKSLPYEVSMAVTLQTDTRGPRGRGRMYLPPFATALVQAGGGKFGDADINAIGGALGTFLAAHTTATTHVPVVVSRRALQLHEVTSLRIGHVPDSQRRRRNKVPEAPLTVWTKA